MRTKTNRRPTMVLVLLATAVGAGVSYAATSIIRIDPTVHACYQVGTGRGTVPGTLRIRPGTACPAGTRPIDWARLGPRGATGPPGPSFAYSQVKVGEDGVTYLNGRSAEVVGVDVPDDGYYMVTGEVTVQSPDIACTLIGQKTGGGAIRYDIVRAGQDNGALTTLPLSSPGGPGVGRFTVDCAPTPGHDPQNVSNTRHARITAIRLGGYVSHAVP